MKEFRPVLLALCCAPFVAAANAQEETKNDWTIHAQVIHTAAGTTLEGGTIRVQGGKIAGLSKGGGKGELEVFAVTPGMIELAPNIDMGNVSVEQSTETVFDQSVAQSLDLFSHRWKRLLHSGVTSVMASAPDFNVFGGLSLCMKTGGKPTVEARLIRADVCLRAAVGTQPSTGNRPPRGSEPFTFYFRRPTTRMGVEWVFRKAFYDTLAARSGKDPDPVRDEVLEQVLQGTLPIAVKAMGTQDVRTAIFLKEEFRIPRMILFEAVEAWREPELLRRSGAAVCLPPFPRSGRVADGHANDSYFLPLGAAKELHELGVPLALSAGDGAEVGTRLANQAGQAMRGGLAFEDALAAVTLAPARLVGIDDRVGSIEVGKDADLILWNGKPFETTSRIVGVLLDGQLVIDPR